MRVFLLLKEVNLLLSCHSSTASILCSFARHLSASAGIAARQSMTDRSLLAALSACLGCGDGEKKIVRSTYYSLE